METVTIKRQALQQAMSQLKRVIKKINDSSYVIDYEELRDSLVKRFEFCFDSFWKFMSLYLKKKLQIELEVVSPRKVFQQSFNAQLITSDELQTLLNSIEDRNTTTHTYNEATAEEISKNIPVYHETMQKILDRLQL